MTLSQSKSNNRVSTTIILALLLSLFALGLAGFALLKAHKDTAPNVRPTESAWERAKREHKLRVGIGVVPPYTLIDANEKDPKKRYSGLCVDMVNEIANSFDPPWEVEWHEVNWSTLRADMYSGKFDFIPNIVYQTIPQAAEFDFTIPFSYLSVGLGLVRKGDTRFNKIEDLDDPKVTIALATGWTATQFARRNLPKANLLIKDNGDSAGLQFDDLMSGRADIVLQDAPTALNIAKNHPGKVDILWQDNPPMRVAAGFLLRQGEEDYRDFLDVALRSLMVSGTLQRLDEKWKGFGEYEKHIYVPGKGLSQ